MAERYRILRHIASGGMGVVYEAEHLVTRRLVALKLLHPHLALRPEMQERFRREATATARLSADYVAAVTDFGATPDGVPFFAMDLLTGETLAAVMKRTGPMEPADAARYVMQACRGVHHTHQRGLIHRDIKPSNLFVVRGCDEVTCVKILDFGIAKALESSVPSTLTGTGRALGTPSYMSPEQALGQFSVDRRTDVHALGLVLYEALAGSLPFPTSDPMTARCRIARDVPAPIQQHRPDLPAALAAVVHRAIAVDPNDRFATAAALGIALIPLARQARDHADRLVAAGRETVQETSTGDTALGERDARVPSVGLRPGRAKVLARTVLSVGVGIAFGLVGGTLLRVGPPGSSARVPPAALPGLPSDATEATSSAPLSTQPTDARAAVEPVTIAAKHAGLGADLQQGLALNPSNEQARHPSAWKEKSPPFPRAALSSRRRSSAQQTSVFRPTAAAGPEARGTAVPTILDAESPYRRQ